MFFVTCLRNKRLSVGSHILVWMKRSAAGKDAGKDSSGSDEGGGSGSGSGSGRTAKLTFEQQKFQHTAKLLNDLFEEKEERAFLKQMRRQAGGGGSGGGSGFAAALAASVAATIFPDLSTEVGRLEHKAAMLEKCILERRESMLGVGSAAWWNARVEKHELEERNILGLVNKKLCKKTLSEGGEIVKVVVVYGPTGKRREVAVSSSLFCAATWMRIVDMSSCMEEADVECFVQSMQALIEEEQSSLVYKKFYCTDRVWSVELYSALGYVHMERVYARHARCRALQLRRVQRVRGDWPLWKVFNCDELDKPQQVFKTARDREEAYDAESTEFETLCDMSEFTGTVNVGAVRSHAEFEALVAAWKASVPDLSPAELWTLVGTVLGGHKFSTGFEPNLVLVRLEPGCAADVRFRAAVPAPVLAKCCVTSTDGDWPKDTASPRFVAGCVDIRKRADAFSRASAFDALRVCGGATAFAVVAGGLVASVMSTHWVLGAPRECGDTCPCRLAADVDVITTNNALAGVSEDLKGVPGLDISEVPFVSVQRLFAEFDMTHNQGALVVDPKGDLWVAASAAAFGSWATMHSKCTGQPYTARRLLKAEKKGFTPHKRGVEPYCHPAIRFDGLKPKSKVAWIADLTFGASAMDDDVRERVSSRDGPVSLLWSIVVGDVYGVEAELACGSGPNCKNWAGACALELAVDVEVDEPARLKCLELLLMDPRTDLPEGVLEDLQKSMICTNELGVVGRQYKDIALAVLYAAPVPMPDSYPAWVQDAQRIHERARLRREHASMSESEFADFYALVLQKKARKV